MSKEIIALDADGVLLDYNRAYPAAWKAAFGEDLILKNPGMHHAFNEYDCAFKNEAQKEEFYKHFTGELWATMPMCEDALEGCKILIDMGYQLDCVTTMPERFHEFRIQNFILHELPITRTFSVGRDKSKPPYNAKKAALQEIAPIAFVDDFALNFTDLEDLKIFKALVYRQQSDSPSKPYLDLADGYFHNLKFFAEWWSLNRGITKLSDYLSTIPFPILETNPVLGKDVLIDGDHNLWRGNK